MKLFYSTAILTTASLVSSCALFNEPSTHNFISSTRGANLSYRDLSIKESRLAFNSDVASTLLLGSVSTIDGENWLGSAGLALSLRAGRVTFLNDLHANSFWSYAVDDPVESWINSLDDDVPPPTAGAVSVRYLISLDGGNEQIVETRRLINVTTSRGLDCPQQGTGPCWVILEAVDYGHTAQVATTYVDAISHDVTAIQQPLADGYSILRWNRIR